HDCSLQSYCTSYDSCYDLLLLFSFQLSRDLRDLHSFPTRRSSDLFSLSCVRGYPSHSSVPNLKRVPVLDCGGAVPLSDLVLKNGDRKSTRLNSSHVAISYAVFCLKKKKITQHEQQLLRQINTSQPK